MVRVEYRAEPQRPNAPRVVAWSGAFALHVVVLGVLIAPIARPLIVEPRVEPPNEPMWVDWPARPVATPVIEPIVRPVVLRPRPDRARATPVEVVQPIFERAAFAEPVAELPDVPVSDAAPAESAVFAPASARLTPTEAPHPRYPSLGLRRKLEGTVLLRVEVAADGSPRDVTVERSSGHRVLDDAARRQVLEHWHFAPAMRGGVAVPAIGLLPIQFRLTSA